MNQIIKSNVDHFISEYGINVVDDATKLEYFVNYCILERECPGIFKEDPELLEDIHTGQGGDKGIDGLVIIVNEKIITTLEEFQAIKDNKLNVRFLFIQTKSGKFDCGEILKTGNGIRAILTGNKIKTNAKVDKYIDIIKEIYNKSYKFGQKPSCEVYYVAMSKWTGDADLVNAFNNIKRDLDETELLKSIEIEIYDTNKLEQLYRSLSHSISKTIELQRKVAFPDITGVKEAYIGLASLKDIANLISDDSGKLIQSLFTRTSGPSSVIIR